MNNISSSDWIMNFLGQKKTTTMVTTEEEIEATHRKRLALILRYIASMHHSSDNGNSNGSNGSSGIISFVRECGNDEVLQEVLLGTDFFQGGEIDGDTTNNNVFEEVLFSTSDFRHLVEADGDCHDYGNSSSGALSLFPISPFSFYASSSSSSTFHSHSSTSILSSAKTNKSTLLYGNDGRTCWLRLTRLIVNPEPKVPNRGVHNYLRNWAYHVKTSDYNGLLTLEKMHTAPKVKSDTPQRNDIQSFLRQYKTYLRREKVRKALEPIYNCLFEWMQQKGASGAGDEELIWGFGNARMVREGKVVNGPLLEVMVEVELAQDGALLVRPRGHTGVALNREVMTFLGNDDSRKIQSDLYRTVSEMETNQLSPGQPKTYALILKRIAVELSSGGKFQPSSSANRAVDNGTNNTLTVTDSWCLYRRQKPRTLWARDASALEERLLLNNGTTVNIPKAAYALTHGPGYFVDSMEHNSSASQKLLDTQTNNENGIIGSLKSALFGRSDSLQSECTTTLPSRLLFPLPTSEVQTRIADLMLNENYPAVVCEGPPGTGKTHTIANILCAYLCRGKRVLVTSKGAPALSVLRDRLPKCVQELCVDVSMSETTGMRQLQQTVEQLADKVSRVSNDIELEKCQLIQHNIDTFQQELSEIDNKFEMHSERKRQIILSKDGQQLADIALCLLEKVPWLMNTFTSWTVVDVRSLHQRVESLLFEDDDDVCLVSNCISPPDDALIDRVAIEAGEMLSYVKNTAVSAIYSIPVLGGLLSKSPSKNHEQLTDIMNNIRVNNNHPRGKDGWKLVLRALRHDKAIQAFHYEVIEAFKWPTDEVYESHKGKRRLKKNLLAQLDQVVTVKELACKLNMVEEHKITLEITVLDRRRSKVIATLQHLAEKLVEATVVTELSRMFSPEAQSALIKFSQLAGKAKFNRASSTQGKMSQRQKRHRQEYLNCFEECVRHIPCWVLTSSQINDYLPPEFGLFDLVVIDEASQSDVTVLPGMLRGKQWLIVGDGKQVSPGENFISETQINSLRVALPESPLEDSLLPGHSFFDLSAQCFPRGRVVLREHFRCAPEIIRFSNDQFYGSRLVPLRLPTSSERMSPSVIDVRVEGLKTGKVNETECDTIVSMVQELIQQSPDIRRSIGIISLVGSEQSRLIRGRLLDIIGPQKYKEHDILVGDPPTFQGAERDCIFLSMVCSPGSIPSQSQLMHAQRANVALSRARDRMILVRSIDISHIANADDIKSSIIEFFTEAETSRTQTNDIIRAPLQKGLFSFRLQMERIIETRLRAKRFIVRRMGIVLDAISVENEESGNRAAICLVCAGESNQEWLSMLIQQKSIERVGWNCMRVDALNGLLDFETNLKSIVQFLASVGVEPCSLDEAQVQQHVAVVQGIVEVEDDVDETINDEESHFEPICVVSSDEEEEASSQLGSVKIEHIEIETDVFQPGQFGDEVNLEFLRQRQDSSLSASFDRRMNRSANQIRFPGVDAYSSDDLEDSSIIDLTTNRRRKKYRRLHKYARDGRYYPGNNRDEDDQHRYDVK